MQNALTQSEVICKRVCQQDTLISDFQKQRGTYEDILLVLGLSSGDDAGSDHSLFPGLGDVHVVDTVLGALVDVVGHLFGNVLGTDVDLWREGEQEGGVLPERRSC